MPTDSKAGCLYPNNARALRAAKAAGFDNCLVPDMLGNIAETATSNIFLVKDGVVRTPVPNGSFLNGITRQRTIGLLRAEGMARVDFFYEEGGRGFLCNEINTMPGFTRLSMFPSLWQASGLSYQELITELIELALK